MVLRWLKWLITPQHKPLSHIRQDARADIPDDDTPELGMEALDMGLIRQTQRRNHALEATNDGHIARHRRGRSSFLNAADRATPTQYDDKGYAQTFFAQFLKNKERRNDR